MVEASEMASIFGRVESRAIESKHCSTREERRTRREANVEHDEEYGSTLSADDHISCRGVRSIESDSNGETSNEISFVAVILECQEF